MTETETALFRAVVILANMLIRARVVKLMRVADALDCERDAALHGGREEEAETLRLISASLGR